MKKLPATVFLLGYISLLNDLASDMIMPLLPVFLATVLGAGPAVIGLIEGVAEATASLLKLWSGRLGDRGINPKRLVVIGYSLSNLARPLLGLAPAWSAVLALRFADRVGKGMRTTPRDALLSTTVDNSQRGRAFGVHRAMDHAGAMLGPLLASALLALGLGMREVFIASVVPGALAVGLLVFGLHVPRTRLQQSAPAPLRWTLLHPNVRALVATAGGLALVAVPDVFLVLWLNHRGITLFWIPLLWALAHGVRALVALPAGQWSDKRGRVPVLLGGWGLRAAMLFSVPWVEQTWAVIAVFLAYAAATASTEGAERALIGDAAAPESKGTAFGLYHMMVGLLALPGALWFGAVWQHFNMASAFIASSVLTLAMAAALALMARRTLATGS